MYKDAWNVLQIVNIGSGVSLLAVYGPNNYRRTSGTRSVLMCLSCFLIHMYVCKGWAKIHLALALRPLQSVVLPLFAYPPVSPYGASW
jgi:hypothetical protein